MPYWDGYETFDDPDWLNEVQNGLDLPQRNQETCQVRREEIQHVNDSF